MSLCGAVILDKLFPQVSGHAQAFTDLANDFAAAAKLAGQKMSGKFVVTEMEIWATLYVECEVQRKNADDVWEWTTEGKTYEHRLGHKDNLLSTPLKADGISELYRIARKLSMDGVRALRAIQQKGMDLAWEDLKAKYEVIEIVYQK